MDSTDNIETSAKSNHPATRNTHTKMEAKNEKSIGSLRSFRMNKPKKNNINTNQKSNPSFPMQKNETNIDKFSNFTKKPHPCTVCEACFDKKDELSAHLIERHGYRRTFQCPICKKKFATKEAIKKHMVENHKINDSKKNAEVNGKPQQCMICDASFDDRQDLTKHINDVHDSFYKNVFLKKSQFNNIVRKQEQQNLNLVSTDKFGTAQKDGNKKIPQLSQNLVTHMLVECFICKVNFSGKTETEKHINEVHMTVHKGKHKFQCPSCDKVFSEKAFIRNHIAWFHEGKKAHKCSVCTQCFLEPEKLATHMHKLHTARKCPICGMVLADQKKLKTHFAIVHEGKIPFKCPVCDENFSSRQDWKEHVRQMNHFQCKLCDDKFQSLPKLSKHSTSIHAITIDEGGTPFQCTFCKSGFENKQKIKNHPCSMQIQSNFFETPINESKATAGPSVAVNSFFQCKFCPEIFSTYIGLESHIRLVHRNLRPRKCAMCSDNGTWFSENTIKEHIALIHDDGSTKDCDDKPDTIEVETKENVDYHDPIAPENVDKPDQIGTITEKKTAESSDQIKTLNCFACEASFPNGMWDLHCHIIEEHGIIHQNIQKFQCPKCQDIVTEKKYLKNHIAWVHEGKKPNVCNSCNRGFLEVEELEEHNLKANCKKSNSEDIEKFKNNKINLQSALNLAANPKQRQQKVFKESPNIDAIENAKRKADSDLVNPKLAKFVNFGITSKRESKPYSKFANFGISLGKIQNHKRHQCALCYQSFDSTEILSAHMITAHKTKHPYQCSVCDKPLKSKSSLEKHITMAHEKGASNPCFICHTGFFTKSDLARHVYDDHYIPPISGITCQCPLCFITLSVNSISKKKNVVLSISKSKLKMHLLSCVEKKLDVCFTCKVKFEDEAQLKTHMNYHETEDVCIKCLNNDNEHCKECGCMKCGGKTPVERLVFCEKCQFYIHFECLPHPIESLDELPGGSDTDFFCPSCSDENLKEILDIQMLDGLKNETRSPKLERMEADEIQSNFNEFDPLALETQDTFLKPEPDMASDIVQSTVIMKPKQCAYEKDQGYWSGIGWKEHMKPVHKIEYQVAKNVSTQKPDYHLIVTL